MNKRKYEIEVSKLEKKGLSRSDAQAVVDAKEIEILVAIGNDAESGKICKHCGRSFKKAVGYSRKCKKCEESEW